MTMMTDNRNSLSPIVPAFTTKFGAYFCDDHLKVLRQLAERSIDLVLTEPPRRESEHDQTRPFLRSLVMSQLFRVLKPGGVLAWIVRDSLNDGCHAATPAKDVVYLATECGFTIVRSLVMLIGNPDCGDYEHLIIASRGRARTKPSEPWASIRRYKTYHQVWPRRNLPHPEVMSPELARDVISHWSFAGDVVLDPMAGAGISCVVAEQLKRRWIGVDCYPEYCRTAHHEFIRTLPRKP